LDVHIGPRDIQLGLSLAHLRLEGLRVDARDDVPGFDFVIEVRQEFLDLAGHLGAHLNRDDGIQGAARGYGTDDGPAFDRGQPERGCSVAAVNEKDRPHHGSPQEQGAPGRHLTLRRMDLHHQPKK
jgi:hypothetical protein